MAVNDSVMNVATRINTERMQTQPVEIPIKVKYKNYQGITSIRTIIPQQIHYGSMDVKQIGEMEVLQGTKEYLFVMIALIKNSLK